MVSERAAIHVTRRAVQHDTYREGGLGGSGQTGEGMAAAAVRTRWPVERAVGADLR
jgi:hypothetical protein